MAQQVTLHDGTVAQVTRNNYGALADQQMQLEGVSPGTPEANAIANSFRQLAGYDAVGFGDGTLPDNAPGGGSPFWAGLETLFASPKAFVQDLTGNQDQNNFVPAGPGGGSPFLAGLEKLFHDPNGFFQTLGNPLSGILPDSNTATVWLVLGTISILGVAYVAHKAL